MSAIVEMRDGYGWALGGADYEADENGVYIEMTGSKNPVKTIYVNEQKIAPVYIFWQVRIYNESSSTNSCTATITGLLSVDPITTDTINISGDGSTLLTVQGYATGEVTVTIIPGSANALKIYVDNETGV